MCDDIPVWYDVIEVELNVINHKSIILTNYRANMRNFITKLSTNYNAKIIMSNKKNT